MADEVPSNRRRVGKEKLSYVYIGVILAAFVVMMVAWASLGNHAGSKTDGDLLLQLTTEQIRAKLANKDADTTSLDRRIQELRAKLAQDESKQQLARQQEEIQRDRAAQAAFQKRCEATKQKRVSDLTVNDVEFLKECGVSVPRLLP
jgi:hypothetical protein